MISAATYPAFGRAASSFGVKRVLEVFLHLGVHRTGTTTFQAFLAENSGVLGRAGVAVWTPERTRDGLLSGVLPDAGTLPASVARRGRQSGGVVQIACGRLFRTGYAQLAVSDENLLGRLRQNLGHCSLYPDAARRLARLYPAFGKACRRIAITIRAYDGYWSSALAQSVARGYPLPDRALLDRLVTQPRRWRDVIRDVAAAYPDATITVTPFERSMGRSPAQLEVLLGHNVDLPRLADGGAWRNRSLDAPALRALIAERGEVTGPATADIGGTDRWMPFDAAKQRALRAQYHDDIAWLRAGADGLAQLAQTPPVGGHALRGLVARTGMGTSKEVSGPNKVVPNRPGPKTRGQGYDGQGQVV